MPLRRAQYAVAALLVLLAFAFQGSRGLYEPDEGRYTDVALQMRWSGDLLVPRLDPEHPHYTKPPLTYWSIAAGMSALGENEWGARLPAALAYLVTALGVALLAARLGAARPELAALVWGTMLLPFVGGNLASTDILLTAFETLAVLGFATLEFAPAARTAGLWTMWLGFGLAFATKGPPGLLPLLGILAYGVATHGARGAWRLFAWAPVLAFLVLAAGWFAWIVARDPRLLDYFLVYETLDRVATDVHHRNPGWLGLVKAYGSTIAAGTLPWLPLGLWAAWRARRGTGAPRGVPMQAPLAGMPREDRFLLAWLLVPFAVFCLAQSRLPLYPLPLSAPLALWIARRLEAAPPVQGRRAVALTIAWALALVALKGVGAHLHAKQDSRAFARELSTAIDVRPFRELVFVGGPARYGLALYLHRDVEAGAVATAPGRTPGIAPRHGVCDELAEHEAPLFLVRGPELAAFRRAADGCTARGGRTTLRVRGQVREWTLVSE